MTKVSDRLNRLSESATLAMAQMSRELQAKGVNVISLSLGEPDFETPEGDVSFDFKPDTDGDDGPPSDTEK